MAAADSHTRAHEPYIGIFNDSYPPIMDGVTLTVENYVHGFMSHGLPTCIVTPWNPVAVKADCPVLKYFSLPIWNRKPYRYGYPKLDPLIWHRLRHTPFRLVHSHCPFSSGRLAVYVKRKQHVPLIGTFHSKYRTDLEHSFASTPWMVPIIMRRILNFFNACDEVWIPQARVEETVREYGYRGPLTVVENGIDICPENYDENSRRQAIERLGQTDDGRLRLIFVGQHIVAKGLPVIMDALETLRGRIPFRMDFVGDGYARRDLEDRIRRSGLEDCVHVNGPINDRDRLQDIYTAADLFLFPSMYDNAPLVIREAAACGTPAILLRGSTASEVITDGVNGFLSDNSGSAYATLIEALNSDRRRIRTAAEGARQTLTRRWDDVVEEVLDRYRVLLKSKNTRQ